MAELITTAIFSDPNLKAYYQFSTGALTTDSTANTHTLSAISDPAETTGRFGGGVDYDSNDAHSAVDGADFKPTGNFSVGAWIKGTLDDFKSIFQSFAQNTNVAGITFIVNQTTGRVRLVSGKNTGVSLGTDYQEAVATTDTRDGAWHLAVGTWDGSNLRVYIDGNGAEATVVWTNAPAYQATNYVRIGCASQTGVNNTFWTGQLDEVFFLNGTALSAAQVLTLYQDTLTSNSALTTNKGYW